jgi:hypothetical protein
VCYTVEESLGHGRITVETIDILTKRIDHGAERWLYGGEYRARSPWQWHKNHNVGRINTVGVDFLEIILETLWWGRGMQLGL